MWVLRIGETYIRVTLLRTERRATKVGMFICRIIR